MAAEDNPVGWWFIVSDPAAGTEEFSACIVRSDEGWAVGAMSEARRLDILPDGEPVATPLRHDRLPGPEWRDRRLTADDVLALTAEAKRRWG